MRENLGMLLLADLKHSKIISLKSGTLIDKYGLSQLTKSFLQFHTCETLGYYVLCNF
jgi:hypothetical protein